MQNPAGQTPNPTGSCLSSGAYDEIIWNPKGLGSPASLAVSCSTYNLCLGLALLHAYPFLQQMPHVPASPTSLGLYLTLSVIFTTLQNISSEPPYSDSEPDTHCLAPVTFRNLGTSYHSHLILVSFMPMKQCIMLPSSAATDVVQLLWITLSPCAGRRKCSPSSVSCGVLEEEPPATAPSP